MNRLAIQQRIKTDGLLLFVSAVWGSGFVAQRIASESMGHFTFNGVRFFLGALFLLTLVRFRLRIERSDLRWVLFAGGLLFGASTFQQVGIKTTTAANAGFITGLYVVIIPIILFFFGRQRIHWSTWTAAILAVIGALFLSTGGQFEPAPGDWYELAGAFLWAAHVIVVGKMARQMDALQFSIGQFLITGVLNALCGLFFETGTSPLPAAWLSVLYSAIFPVGLGFTLQVIGQKTAHTTDAAIIFSMEAVFAALAGYLFLNEILVPLQLLGCAFILAAMLLAQLRQMTGTEPIKSPP